MPAATLSPREVFWRTTWRDRNLASVSQAGLVNNLNDGMAWGLFPLFFAAAQMGLEQIAVLAAIYPATWGVAQIFTGALSDRVGRKWLIAGGMWVQAIGIAIIILAGGFAGFALGAALLGLRHRGSHHAVDSEGGARLFTELAASESPQSGGGEGGDDHRD